jgi:Peptidase family M1 domain
MNTRRVFLLALATLAAGGGRDASWAQPDAPGPDLALSERVVAYDISARLDLAKKTIEGTEVLTYRNRTGQALDTFPFHLYLQGFQPESSFMTELHRDRPQFTWREKYRGSIEVTSFTVPGLGELAPSLEFIQPDDGNRGDHTVFQVRLPRPVAPGAEVQFRMIFRAKLPETLARTGYKRTFVMGAQWFPKIGVWWRGAWNAHQFHRSAEFFSDFGTYRVKLTVPRDLVLAASGERVESQDNPDGTRTVTYRADDVHDFAWAADSRFKVVEDLWGSGSRSVRIRLLMQPEHVAQAPRWLTALKGAMDCFNLWYGPYPYGELTVVDVPHGARAGGMEYPTLITVSTTSWMPAGLRMPEVQLVHEFSHQYWYGMVASNEAEEAWLDEGLTSYSTIKVVDVLYGPPTSYVSLGGLKAGLAEVLRLQYRGLADVDPLARPADRFLTESTYEAVNYGKAASALLTLEGLIGKEAMRASLRAYFLRHRFTHPTGDDFVKAFEDTTGKDLGSFFDQAIRGTQVLDYAVVSVDADPVEWFKDGNEGTAYRSSVVVHRRGDFVLPVEVEVRFEGGDRIRESWDGRDRWIRYSYDRKTPVVSAQVDPEGKVWLDRNLLNNGLAVAADGRATRKLSNRWLFLTQLLGQWLAWLA